MPLAASPPKPRALIVNDDATVPAFLKDGLESEGIEVVTAPDGSSALRQLVDHLLELGVEGDATTQFA